MDQITIRKDSKIVPVLVAQAHGERVDSEVAANADKLVKDLVSDFNPHNRYQLAQLIGFSVDEVAQPEMNWLETVADVKNVGYGERAQFKVRHEGIRAFMQAKGATTARSKVANHTFSMDTVAVSARPAINIVDLKIGRVQMSDLVKDAAYQMNLAKLGYIRNVLNAAYKDMASPYYAAGAGIVPKTLNDQLTFWMRMLGGATIMGDFECISKLADLTGFAASTDSKQFANEIIMEQNTNGYIGVYKGAKVVNMTNPLLDGTDKPILETNKLFILPTSVDTSLRPLKVVNEGETMAQEFQNIDDQVFETRLDQWFGAAMAYGDRPYMSVYEDTSI